MRVVETIITLVVVALVLALVRFCLRDVWSI